MAEAKLHGNGRSLRITKTQLALLAAVICLPGGVAEPLVVSDPADDWVTVTPAGVVVPATPADAAGSDLLQVRFSEEVHQFILALTLDSVEPWQDDGAFAVGVFELDVEGRRYSFAAVEGQEQGPVAFEGNTTGHVTTSLVGTTLLVSIPRTALADRDGLPPQAGVPILIQSVRYDVGRQASATRDGLNIAGVPPAYVTEHAPNQIGDLVATAPVPVRASNGGAEAFVFRLSVRNTASEERTMTAAPAHVPPDWDVRMQDIVRLAGGQTLTLPVLVATSSGHQHGTVESVDVALTELESGNTGAIALSVDYVNPPQPAGHHPTLWLHADSPTHSWMDTQETGPAVPLRGDQNLGYDGDIDHNVSWTIAMDPSLMRGLHFMPNRTADARVSLLADALDRTVRNLTAALVICHPDVGDTFRPAGYFRSPQCDEPWKVLAVAHHPGGVVPRQTAQGFEIHLTIPESIGVIPFTAGSNLALFVNADVEEPLSGIPEDSGVLGMRLDPSESSLTLPLLEYQDPVIDTFLEANGLRMTMISDRSLRVAAGTAWFEGSLENLRTKEMRVELFALGPLGADVRWQPSSVIRLPPSGSAPFAMGVAVPADAPNGAFYDLILEARGDDGAGMAAVAVRVVVDHDADVMASPEITHSKPSPAFSVVIAIGLASIMAGRQLRAS